MLRGFPGTLSQSGVVSARNPGCFRIVLWCGCEIAPKGTATRITQTGQSRNIMRIFKSDLLRAFAVGFVLATVAICVIMGGGEGSGLGGGMVPSAIAAPAH